MVFIPVANIKKDIANKLSQNRLEMLNKIKSIFLAVLLKPLALLY